MAGAIEVREALPGEAETVLALVERLLLELEHQPEEFAGLERKHLLRELEAAGPRFTAFLAWTATGEAVGVITLVETFALYAGGRYGVIDEMWVDPAWRSRQVGRKLIEAVRARGRARGWLRIDVTAPPEAAWERTVRFYQAQGFTFTGPKLRLMLR